MSFIFEIFINAIVLLIAARLMPNIDVKNFGSALIVALLIGVLNPTIGFFLRLFLNVATLGIPFLLGLGFIIRLLVTAVIIKLVDSIIPGFKVKNMTTSLILAIIMAIAGTVIGSL